MTYLSDKQNRESLLHWIVNEIIVVYIYTKALDLDPQLSLYQTTCHHKIDSFVVVVVVGGLVLLVY